MKLVVTIGGPPGSGTTTIAEAIAKHFNLRFFSTGIEFRRIAQEKGLEVDELSKTAERNVDEEIDDLSKKEAQKGNVVIESDLAAWINKDLTTVKIWLNASLENRAQRIFNDEKKRVAEKYNSIEEVKERLEKRFAEDKRRYKQWYNIDLDDLTIYDLIIDTDNLTVEEVINEAIHYIENKIKQ